MAQPGHRRTAGRYFIGLDPVVPTGLRLVIHCLANRLSEEPAMNTREMTCVILATGVLLLLGGVPAQAAPAAEASRWIESRSMSRRSRSSAPHHRSAQAYPPERRVTSS